MKKRSVPHLLLAAVLLLTLTLSGCGKSDPLSTIVKKAKDYDHDITLTDIRRDVPTALDDYNNNELEAIIFMVRDWQNKELADKEYYEKQCDALDKSDINALYELLSGEKAEDKPSEKGDEKPGEDGGDGKRDKNDEEEGGIPVLLIVGIAGGVLVLIIVIVVIVVAASKGGKGGKGGKKGGGDDGDDDPPYDDEDGGSDDEEERPRKAKKPKPAKKQKAKKGKKVPEPEGDEEEDYSDEED